MCTVAPSPGQVGVRPERRVRDAYASLAYLRALPVVDGRRVGVMGGSHGGTTTLAVMASPVTHGDDWTPAEDCRVMAETSRAAGYPVTIKIYPGAHHSFDSPHPVRFVADRINPSAPSGRGATTGGDPAAWADSIREVAAFFGQLLK